MTKLVVRLLGGFRVELNGAAVYDFETDKARALLAYLIVEADRPHRRETLACLLWPDRPDTVAHTNLRQTLARVRRALGDNMSHDQASPAHASSPPFLFVTRTDVQFNSASDYVLDVAELEAFARDDPAHLTSERPQLLPEAYCADFLAGFAVPDSEAFQTWVLSQQEHYHRLAIEILDEQSAGFESTGDYEKTAATARLQLRMEPWLEETHRRCMRSLALAGRRDEALHQYEICRRALQTELDVEPAATTQALYADIRAGRLAAGSGGHEIRPVPDAPAASRQPSHGGQPASGQPQGLPPQTRRAPRLVARADETGRLSRSLDAALAGETQVVFVSGDAGSGKTALLEAFADSAMAGQPGLLVAGARCNPGGSLDACAPLRKLAETLFGDLANETAWRLAGRDQVDRLQRATDSALAALGEHGLGLIDALVTASSITRRAGPDRDSIIRDCLLGPQPPHGALSQTVLFDQLTCTLAAMSRTQPLLLLFDDLHWVDEGTAAFLLYLGRQLSRSRILVLGAYRAATVALARHDPHSGEVIRHPLAAVVNELRRERGEILVELDRVDGRAFVEAYVDTEPNHLGARFRDALYAHTGGHALFTVETLRNLQERGELIRDEAGRWVARESLDWGVLPARVEAAIAERIDRVPGSCRRILAAASVQGDDFSGELVAEVIAALPHEVLECLSGALARQHHLVRPTGMQRLGSAQQSIYRFTHHLFQKYLYDQLDPVEKARWHGAAASSLDRQVRDNPEERERLAARLAWHYEAGGLPLPAARALLDAGRHAMRVSAFREALSRFDHGLKLLAQGPPAEERAEIERQLEVARLGPLRNLEGIASASHENTLARAAAAWAGQRGRPQLVLLVGELERVIASGRLGDALTAGERLRAEALESGEDDLVGFGHLAMGMAHHFAGNARESESHIDWVLAWLNPERGTTLRAATGIDLRAEAFAFSSINRWLLGYPEQALARSQQALAAARAAGAAVAEAAALVLGASLLFLLRADPQAMAEQSEQCLRLCVQQGIGMWRVFAEILLGRLMIDRAEVVAGIERISGAIAAWQVMGMVIACDAYTVILADGCLAAARLLPEDGNGVRASALAAGLTAIETVTSPSRRSGGLAYEAELHRLRGELLLEREGLRASEEAAACFGQAMHLGSARGLRAWELRAVMSLVRLRQRQGVACAAQLEEARGALRELYGRFTEGFAFTDLRDAAALSQAPAAGDQ